MAGIDQYTPGIGLSAGLLMLRWGDERYTDPADYRNTIKNHLSKNTLKIERGDTVNVFINFESVLANLALQSHLTSKVSFFKQKVALELESAILNLVAHYRAYFRKEQCQVKVFLYYTDLLSDAEQEMCVYNKYYRSYYRNQYLQNPQFRVMGDVLTKIIIPEVQLILSFIRDCYFIKAPCFDGSLIPLIVSGMSDAKNVIITGDIFDTLYLFNPNFVTLYIQRRFRIFEVTSEVNETVRTIIKDEPAFDLSIFNAELYYQLLLSVRGSKIRNIRSATGYKYGRLISDIQRGLNEGIILRDFSSLESIIQLFPQKYADGIKNGFRCMSLELQQSLLTDVDVESVKSQIVDQIDIESVQALNNQRFLEFPIRLPSLLS